MEQFDHIKSLFEKYIQGIVTAVETSELAEIVQEVPEEKLLEVLESIARSVKPDPAFGKAYWDSLLSDILQKTKNADKRSEYQETGEPEIASIRHMRNKWWWAAAAVLIIALGTTAIIFNNKKSELAVTNGNKRLQDDVAPGGNKAILTLANGAKIILDSATQGILAHQGDIKIIKQDSGKLVYVSSPSAIGLAEVYNTMSTPRGGQYKLQLADGTGVWLNSASSITFPTSFTGKERNVEITGEAYFEVAKNKSKPFHVKVNGMQIEVLGTRFDINSYGDEGVTKTTLLEGSVKVVRGGATAILKPGQQAQATSQVKVVDNTDLDQVMAWKNGLFNFDGADLHTVMRQLSRWYDIDVKYEGNVPDEEFQGRLTRDLNLSQVLRILGKMEVKFKLEGKTLTVMP